MKNNLKIMGLMMSAILCMFTSCEPIKVDDSNVVTSVDVKMLVSSETLKWAEGSFIVTFSPSGQTKEIPVNDVFFAFEATPTTEADARLLEEFRSKKVMKATTTAICDGKDTEVSITSNLKVKPGVEATDDKTYDFEVMGVISYHKGLNGEHGTHAMRHQFGIKGSDISGYLSRLNSVVSLKIQ